MVKKLISWFDNKAVAADAAVTEDNWSDIDWLRVIPFVLMHLACFAVFWVGFSWFALVFSILSSADSQKKTNRTTEIIGRINTKL